MKNNQDQPIPQEDIPKKKDKQIQILEDNLEGKKLVIYQSQNIDKPEQPCIKVNSRMEEYFKEISQEESFNFPLKSDRILQIDQSLSFSQSPVNSGMLKKLTQSSNPPIQRSHNYQKELSDEQSSSLKIQYRKKRSPTVDKKEQSPYESLFMSQDPSSYVFKTFNYEQELHQKGSGADLEREYEKKREERGRLKKSQRESRQMSSQVVRNKYSSRKASREFQDKKIKYLQQVQRQRQSMEQNKGQKQSTVSIDEIDLKKELIFSLVLTLVFLHLYYAVVYKLEYFTITNLFLILFWVTVSPHHQRRFIVKCENKQLHKVLFEFIKYRHYHLNFTKPIFKSIFWNFLLIDIGLFKLAIQKFGLFGGVVQSSLTLKAFMQDYVDLGFVNTLEDIIVNSWNVIIEGLEDNQNEQNTTDQFFILKIFNFFVNIFHVILAITAGVFSFFSSFFTQFALNGQYFLYLALIILCGMVAFRNFLKVNQKVGKVIESSVIQKVQNPAKKQETGTLSVDKSDKEMPLLSSSKSPMRSQMDKKQSTQTNKKKRKSSAGSNLSQVELFNIKKSLQQSQQSPVYQQLSKYLLIFSLISMYGLCYLAQESYRLRFVWFEWVSVKKVWAVLLCLYSFLIVEYCRRSQQGGLRVNCQERSMKIKIYLSTFLLIILILHDFVITKVACESQVDVRGFLEQVRCFQSQTRYKYYFDELFFNPHSEQSVPSEDKFKLSILIEYVMKVIILLNFRFHKFYLLQRRRSFFSPQQQAKLIEDDRSSVENPNLAESFCTVTSIGAVSTQSYKLKKKAAKISKTLQRNTIILLTLTVFIMTLTNSISNIVILLGTFLNIPQFRDSKFRTFLMVGLTLGLIFQPDQLLYFVLGMLMIYVRGQDMQFSMHSHWIMIQFSRVYIMFSKVSVINFLMGLIPSSVLVMYCIGFRIVFNYFQWISVFMGTEDNYNKTYLYSLVPNSFFVDLSMWVFMIMLKTYTPNLTNKFPNSNITDIFRQYPVIEKVEPVLKIFRIIQLVAYVAIQLIVFTETPSIIVFTRLFMHLIIAAVDLANEKANETLKNLWKANLYVSLFIAFLKYFYLLNRYDNLSNWLMALLNPLERNWSLIGLWPVQRTESVLSLGVLFLPDLCVIILSMLVEYSLQVKIFQSYRQLFVQREPKIERDESNSEENSYSNKLEPQNANALPTEQPHVQFKTSKQATEYIFAQAKRQKDTQYLYKKYIKELSFKFKSTSILARVLSDFLYDIFFMLLCLVYFLLENTQSFAGSWLNLPHFIIGFVIFIHQQDRKLPKRTFLYSIIYSCATILLLYLKYLYSYVTHPADGEGSYFYKLSDILNKYIFFLLGCLFYKLHDALREQLEISKQNKDRRRNMLYTLIMPNFDKNFAHSFIKEITVLWINLFKSVILAVFVANFFTSTSNFVFNLFMVIYLIFILAFPHHLGFHAEQDTLKHYWVFPFLLSFCFTIWCEDLIGYAGLILVRVYIIFFMEFQLSIDLLFCEYVTQSQRHLVQKIDDRFNRKSIDKLSIIAEQKQGISRVLVSESEEESSKAWPYRNLYKTILLILPQLCMVLMLLSQILLYRTYLSALMCLMIIMMFFYSVKFIEDLKVFTNRFKKILKIYFGVSIKVIIFMRYLSPYGSEVNLRLGVVFLCMGFFYYMYLVEDVDKEKCHFYLISKSLRVTFMQGRCAQALSYWQIKSEFVSELGSQIHNEKKLLKLQKFYITKEKVSRRVQKLIEDIQQRGRMNIKKNYSAADFDIIDQIIDYREEGQQYELFSNMLVILSLEDLQYCLELMNHYYRPCVEKRNLVLKESRDKLLGVSQGEINQLITAEMKQIRMNVLKTYHGSIYLAFKQYKHSLAKQNQQKSIISYAHLSQNIPPQKSQMDNQEESQFSQQQQMVNFEKAEFMNSKYNKCMERIHEKSMEIGWFWRKVIQNLEIISLVIVTGWNFFGGVYSIPANFAVFGWALILETKTTVLLWSFFMLYSGLIIIVKFLLPHLPSLPILNFIFYYYPNHCYYEFVIILVSFFMILLIKLGGTEHVTYFERESIYDAFYRKGLNKAAHKIQSELQPQFIQVYKTLSQPSKHSFFYRVFSKSRLKPGKDFYPLMSAIQLVILMYIFFFYDMMEFESRNNRKSLGEILTVNQFSKHMMIILFTQVIIMILDRFIASLNLIDVDNQSLENFLLNFAFSDHIKYRAPQNVTHVGFFDFILILKYLFHVFLLVLVNFFVYFYIPSSGFQKSLIPQCQNAICGKSYTFLSIFLLLYLAYFVVSGLQIKHGFSRDKCRNKLMEKYHWVNYYIYVLFTGIPFLWEFKKICDWTITTTALPLFHWMKFEDINARLYQSKCQAEMLKIKPRAKTPWTKYFLGPAGCIFILGVVFSPLLLYSSLNPFAVKDQVLAAEINLNLLVNGSVDYKFFSTSHAIITQNISKLSESYSDEFESSYKYESSLDFEDNNDFYLKMSSYPDENFKISQPAVERLSSRIGRAISGRKYRFFDMVLHAKIIEKEGGENVIEWARRRLNNTQLAAFKEFISPTVQQSNATNSTISKPETKYFKLQNFYSPIPGTIQNKTICLITTNNGQYYELYTPDKQTNQCSRIEEESPGILLFYSSSTKYKIGFGLVTFYVTYVLLISRLFRLYLTGNLDNVIYQGCHLQRMLILCDAVREARILENLYQEEYLYAFLVDLMRNPRTLKQMSGDFTELRRNLPIE